MADKSIVLELNEVSISYSSNNAGSSYVPDLPFSFLNQSKAIKQEKSFSLEAISFTLLEGESIALTGASGSGKSSILKAINRLVEIDSGKISVLGRSIKDYSLFDLRRNVAYMFQRGLLFPHLSVYENISLPISDKIHGQELNDRVNQLLDDCELDPGIYGQRMPRSLSGGELQRASLALTLVHRPKLLMLDEPFTGLDNETKTQLIDFLSRLRSKFAMSILLVTHDAHEADAMTDRELTILGGKLVNS